MTLSNTLGKILEKVIARRLSALVEWYSLLPPTHMGGRKGISTGHALHWLIEKMNIELICSCHIDSHYPTLR
jgi:hypothetical protein